MNGPLVVGIDAGGTTTRCVVATVDGEILARGQAGGANQRSSGGSPAQALAAALHDAMSRADLDGSQVVFGIVGAAGAGGAGRAAAQQAAELAWREAGLGGQVVAATDLEVAFAAGTPDGDGLLLVAGTGAAAAAFHEGVLRHRCDGYGWLLGDDGSAVWLGREALRAVLAAIDGRGPQTRLIGPVTSALLNGDPPAEPAGAAPNTPLDGEPAGTASRALQDGEPGGTASRVLFDGKAPAEPDLLTQILIGAAYRQPPAALGRLAPLVSAAATEGDEVAARLVTSAAEHLERSLIAVAERAGTTGPIVLTGSVLSNGPVADLVRANIRERFGVEPHDARDGAAGAAALAIARFTGRKIPAKIHARLTNQHSASITT